MHPKEPSFCSLRYYFYSTETKNKTQNVLVVRRLSSIYSDDNSLVSVIIKAWKPFLARVGILSYLKNVIFWDVMTCSPVRVY
jgi:hypothetical protein